MNGLLKQIAHRPWPLPAGEWSYYQEWNNALFLHWKMPIECLIPLVPGTLQIDTIDGEAWISLVAFTMEKIHPRGLPALSVISDFHEVNVRTYVIKDGKPGVYFLSIEAAKTISVLISKTLSGLPYEKARMRRDINEAGKSYFSMNKKRKFSLQADVTIGQQVKGKSRLDKWLTERYCLYMAQPGTCTRYDIHHLEWPLNEVDIKSLDVHYNIENIKLNNAPDKMHYSKGVVVLAWKKAIV
ncbi:MAG: DUF2071 domain-containing protein [Filimonas sp.]|nr:DUF2071 domain-containing protein [Filimonas sp.]